MNFPSRPNTRSDQRIVEVDIVRLLSDKTKRQLIAELNKEYDNYIKHLLVHHCPKKF